MIISMKIKKYLCIILSFFVVNTLNCYASENDFLVNSLFHKVAIEENIDPYLLYSISLVESAKRVSNSQELYVAPHPFAIRTPKGAFYPKTEKEARLILKKQMRLYKHNQIDVGLMQINGQHFKKVNKVEDLLNPETNIRVAAKILKAAMKTKPTPFQESIGRYHSFTSWRANVYGARVLAIYNNLKSL